MFSTYISVPSRGLSYLNEILSMMDETGEVVSVPSRGLSYLNGKTKSYKHTLVVVSVPSRGLSYLNYRYSNPQRLLHRFRPLTGTLLSKRKSRCCRSNRSNRVSVPSRGLSYLNTIRQFSLPKRLFSLVCVANDILMIKEFNVFI